MRTIILTLLALAMSASTALATTITVDMNNGTTYTSSDYNRVYDFINASNSSWDSESDKINIVDYILDGRLNDGEHTYTLVNGTTEKWFANGAESVIIEEIAGYADTNTFGYYTLGTRYEIFAGPDPDGIDDTYSFTLSPAAEFGFYLGVPTTSNTFYYTEASLNTNNEIHAAIFQVDSSNAYILGFEDLPLTNTDADYQDMIVKVTINHPVPEPSTILLVGTGLAGLGLLRRRFKS
jgi:hypothetical protein